MPISTIDPGYRVVIPEQPREAMHPDPGRRDQALAHNGRTEPAPVQPMDRMRGVLAGIDTSVRREGHACVRESHVLVR